MENGKFGRISDPFKLAVYGESLLSKSVKGWIGVFTFAFVAQFAIDVWAWYHAWQYGAQSPWFSAIAATAMAGMILVFDRSVVIHDTQQSRWGWATLSSRLLVLMVLAFITAIPVELRIFEPEVDGKFHSQDTALVDDIRKLAISQEEDVYSQQIKAIREAKTQDSEQVVTSGDEDVENYETRRAVERQAISDRYATDKQALTDRYATDKAEINKQIQEKDLQMLDEIGGKYSGIKGDGARVKRMSEQKDKMYIQLKKLMQDESEKGKELSEVQLKERKDLSQDESAELTAFDQSTTAKVQEMQTGRDTTTKSTKKDRDERISALQIELTNKLNKVRAMNGEELSQEYGGDYQVSRGFLDRFRELRKIEEDDIYNQLIAWGVRLTLMGIGLIVFFLKVMGGKDFKGYYSLGVQMAHGQDEKTRDLAISFGYTDAESLYRLGLSPSSRKAWDAVRIQQAEVSEVIDQWYVEARRISSRKTGDLCLELAVLQGRLQATYQEKVGSLINELANIEAKLDVPVPIWPENLPHGDPREIRNSWAIKVEVLISWGWKDPREMITAGKQAAIRRPALLSDIQMRLTELEHKLFRIIRVTQEVELSEILFKRFSFFRENIYPVLLELREVEQAMQAGGVKAMLPRPRVLQDDGKLDEIWRVTPVELKKLGWGPTVEVEEEIPTEAVLGKHPQLRMFDSVPDNALVPQLDDVDRLVEEDTAELGIVDPNKADEESSSEPGFSEVEDKFFGSNPAETDSNTDSPDNQELEEGDPKEV